MSAREKIEIAIVWALCLLGTPWVGLYLSKYVFWIADIVFGRQG